MFSGIVEEKAQVKEVLKNSQGCVLTVESGVASKDTKVGDSISVNGVCLTVVKAKAKFISFDVMDETLRRTNLSRLSVGNVVNLEQSLKFGDKISGHFVTGHVDCTGKIRAITEQPNKYSMDIEFPVDKKAYLTEKGSLAVDGISLTVAEVKDNCLKVYLIPLTLKTTNLGLKKAGESVNIEFDILGKYSLQHTAASKEKSGIDVSFLKEHGFL
jgi:riboflavin synthase